MDQLRIKKFIAGSILIGIGAYAILQALKGDNIRVRRRDKQKLLSMPQHQLN